MSDRIVARSEGWRACAVSDRIVSNARSMASYPSASITSKNEASSASVRIISMETLL
jgi:hypothetical protein